MGAAGEARLSVEVLPLLPLRDIVLFPYMVVPLFVGREKSIAVLQTAMTRPDRDLVLTTQKIAATPDPTQADLHAVGTVGTIVHLLRLPDQTMKVLVEGKRRARIGRFVEPGSLLRIEVEEFPEDASAGAPAKSRMQSAVNAFERYVASRQRIPNELLSVARSLSDPNRLAYTIVAHLNATVDDKQALLEMSSAVARLERLESMIDAELEILRVADRIRTRVRAVPPGVRAAPAAADPWGEARAAIAEFAKQHDASSPVGLEAAGTTELIEMALRLVEEPRRNALRAALEESQMLALAAFLLRK